MSQGGASELPPGLAAPPTAQGLLAACRRRWLLASVCAVLAGLTAAGGTWLFMPTPAYQAQSLIHVEAQPPAVVFHRGESRSDFQSYQRTQIALAKSRLVLNAALRDPEVAALPLIRDPIDPIGWLQKELVVDFSTAPEILRIGLHGRQPEQMKQIVARVTRAYLDEIVKREEARRRDRMQKLKDLNDRYQETLRSKRRTLRELVENVGSGDPATLALKQRFAQEQLAMTEKELLQVDSERRKLQTDLAVQQDRQPAIDELKLSDGELDELARRDPGIAKLNTRKAELEQEINEAVRVAARGEAEPKVQGLRRELAELESAIQERRRQIRPMLLAQLEARMQQQHRLAVLAARDRLKLLDELRGTLAKDVDRLRLEARSLNKGSLDIESYKQDIAQTEETARKVGSELESLTVEMRAMPRVAELESAFVSQPDDFKRRLMASLAAALAGAFLACWAVAWNEYRCRRIQVPGEIVQGLGIPMLGTVPPLPWPGGAATASGTPSPATLQSSLVDGTRAVLQHTARSQSLRTIMITSAVGGEGKTSLASHLAASLARAGRKTLLIDADLRKPSIHRLLGLPLAPGLSEALLGMSPIDETVQESAVPGLFVIGGGDRTAQALETPVLDRFGFILEAVRDQFDLVIVDSSPVLPVADSLAIGQQVDAVVLSVLRDVSQMHRVYAAQQLLDQMGIRTIGAVLNGIRNSAEGPTYRYVNYGSKPGEAVAAGEAH
jgi:capsular exopolysaccharide synthesis family protein